MFHLSTPVAYLRVLTLAECSSWHNEQSNGYTAGWIASLGSPAGLCGFACWVGGWDICLETSMDYGSLVSLALGDSRVFLDFTIYNLMSDVNVQMLFICCRFVSFSDVRIQTCQLEVLVLAFVISVCFRYWQRCIKIHLVFGYFSILSSGCTVSLEIFGEKFDISSGVRAQQLER